MEKNPKLSRKHMSECGTNLDWAVEVWATVDKKGPEANVCAWKLNFDRDFGLTLSFPLDSILRSWLDFRWNVFLPLVVGFLLSLLCRI